MSMSRKEQVWPLALHRGEIPVPHIPIGLHHIPMPPKRETILGLSIQIFHPISSWIDPGDRGQEGGRCTKPQRKIMIYLVILSWLTSLAPWWVIMPFCSPVWVVWDHLVGWWWILTLSTCVCWDEWWDATHRYRWEQEQEQHYLWHNRNKRECYVRTMGELA